MPSSSPSSSEIVLTSEYLTYLEILDVVEEFPDITQDQLSLIAEIIYNDGWASYEECARLFVFRDECGQYFKVDTGYSVMAGEQSAFHPVRVSVKEALQEIEEMRHYLEFEHIWPT